MNPEPMIFRPDLDMLSVWLEIETDPPARTISSKLLNERARPGARIVSLTLEAKVIVDDDGEFRPLTGPELDGVAYRGASIRLRGIAGPAIGHAAENGSYFTVRELLRAIEETERQTRGQSRWCGGVDVHHIFFAGIHPGDDGVWAIRWDS